MTLEIIKIPQVFPFQIETTIFSPRGLRFEKTSRKSTQNEAKMELKTIKNHSKIMFEILGQKNNENNLKMIPNGAQMELKWSPKNTKLKAGFGDLPRRPSRLSRSSQNEPKMTPT